MTLPELLAEVYDLLDAGFVAPDVLDSCRSAIDEQLPHYAASDLSIDTLHHLAKAAVHLARRDPGWLNGTAGVLVSYCEAGIARLEGEPGMREQVRVSHLHGYAAELAVMEAQRTQADSWLGRSVQHAERARSTAEQHAPQWLGHATHILGTTLLAEACIKERLPAAERAVEVFSTSIDLMPIEPTMLANEYSLLGSSHFRVYHLSGDSAALHEATIANRRAVMWSWDAHPGHAAEAARYLATCGMILRDECEDPMGTALAIEGNSYAALLLASTDRGAAERHLHHIERDAKAHYDASLRARDADLSFLHEYHAVAGAVIDQIAQPRDAAYLALRLGAFCRGIAERRGSQRWGRRALQSYDTFLDYCRGLGWDLHKD
ncbi:hypothetical protein COV94_01165, partial [Candidatus Woesearchaeota archaeon CG11_big_fil_rev_8_21_14_0_20_57_5]